MFITIEKLDEEELRGLEKDIETVYATPQLATAYQHFVCRMVIAISLQKMDTQYAGLADSYYLAALKYFEPVVRRMDLNTLQCFALMAEYSLRIPLDAPVKSLPWQSLILLTNFQTARWAALAHQNHVCHTHGLP